MRTETRTPAAEEFVTTRLLDAPRDLVWQAWTEEKRLAAWWGPKGFTMLKATLDLRPGGHFHYGMRFPDGKSTMWGRFVFREVHPQERILFVNSFSDETGGITRAPFAEDFPLEIHNTLTLAVEGKQTRLTLRGGPLNASAAEQAFFQRMFPSMKQGFNGTWDQLAAYLAAAK